MEVLCQCNRWVWEISHVFVSITGSLNCVVKSFIHLSLKPWLCLFSVEWGALQFADIMTFPIRYFDLKRWCCRQVSLTFLVSKVVACTAYWPWLFFTVYLLQVWNTAVATCGTHARTNTCVRVCVCVCSLCPLCMEFSSFEVLNCSPLPGTSGVKT